MRRHILLTGPAGIGKTTVLKGVIQGLEGVGGFYTQEMRCRSKRTGFKIITLNGRQGILAKEGLRSKFKLGRFGINVKDLEKIGVKALFKALEDTNIRTVVIDEIGKMELVSERFQDAVFKVLNSNKRLLGVIHRADLPILREIKSRADVRLIKVDVSNRENLAEEIKVALRKANS